MWENGEPASRGAPPPFRMFPKTTFTSSTGMYGFAGSVLLIRSLKYVFPPFTDSTVSVFRDDRPVQLLIPSTAPITRTATLSFVTVFMSVSLSVRDPHRAQLYGHWMQKPVR